MAHTALAARRPTRPHTCSAAVVVADLSGHPIYANRAALDILGFPKGAVGSAKAHAAIQRRIQAIVGVDSDAASLPQRAFFTSGRRRYVCRPFLLDSQHAGAATPTILLLIEREPGDPLEFLAMNDGPFRFTPRECQVVAHLVGGQTTKQIANDLNISPNTVKAFIRLVMTKMNVTTRSGIIGRLLTLLVAGE